MFEFVQAYGSWIVLGLLFLVMMRMHGSHGGMGCGMGSHDHSRDRSDTTQGSQGDESGPDQNPGCH